LRFTLFGMIRALALAAVALGAVAVGLGRMNPPQFPLRTPAPVGHVGLPSYTHQRAENSADYLDLAAADIRHFDLPAGEFLDNLSVSPWRDEEGRSQAVGRWSRRGGGSSKDESGLARFTFPGGEALDRIPTDLLPKGLPCWFPDRSARVLFVAGDGRLYRVDFEPWSGGEATLEGPTPQALTWAHPPEDPDRFVIRDPSWPTDSIFGGRLVVSLSERVHVDGRTVPGRPKLWWIRLDAAGTRIIESGPLSRSDAPTGPVPDLDERFPQFGRSPAGEPHAGLPDERHLAGCVDDPGRDPARRPRRDAGGVDLDRGRPGQEVRADPADLLARRPVGRRPPRRCTHDVPVRPVPDRQPRGPRVTPAVVQENSEDPDRRGGPGFGFGLGLAFAPGRNAQLGASAWQLEHRTTAST